MSWKIFDKYAERYDRWYIKHRKIFTKELEIIKKCIPSLEENMNVSLEIGIGSGRFAEKLKIRYGIDLSKNMLKLSKKRGIKVVLADAHRIPFKDKTFSTVFLIFVLCFLKEPVNALKEVYRVLKNKGFLLICFIPRDSELGKLYLKKKESGDIFYSNANFYTFNDVVKIIETSGKFKLVKSCTHKDIDVQCALFRKIE